MFKWVGEGTFDKDFQTFSRIFNHFKDSILSTMNQGNYV